MTIIQADLFGKLIQPEPPKKPDHIEEPELPISDAKTEPIEINASFPCKTAQKIPIDERPRHIKNCPECQKMIRELDEKILKKN